MVEEKESSWIWQNNSGVEIHQYSKKDHSIAHLDLNYREHQGFFF